MRLVVAWICAGLCAFSCLTVTAAEKQFRAGAFAIDVTPLELPVIVNGGMTERIIDKVEDRLHARCLVMDDGVSQIAIVIVDNCMMPRELLDDAKRMASAATKIPVENMLIAATHCHSAPSVFGCLGSDVDEKYAKFLPVQIAKGIQQAHANLQPARIGWAVGRDDKNVASRRWLMKPGVPPTNAFSDKKNDRVMMHPGPANKNAVAATGIIDSDVPVLSLQTKEGQPLAVLTNYSMHYVGAPNLSADYFAVVCEKMTEFLKAGEMPKPFVALHSNGTSGDQWLMDYTKPRREFDRFKVGTDVAAAAYEAYQRIFYYDWVPLVMAEKELELGIRQPNAEELAEAQKMCETFKGRKPQTLPEIYAREAVMLSELPAKRNIKLQAMRIGELGIAAIPNEVFSSTGLQIKIESPTPTTFTIELANGAEGYIPPPKQHKLGGYETWRARSACLEVNAEPKIRATVLDLLNQVNEKRADEQPILTPEAPPADAQSKAEVKEEAKEKETKPAVVASPLSPEDALKHFQITKGFQIELVAAEPLIVDPVAFDWGFDGKLWVVEMHDYPNGLGVTGPDEIGPPGGRVKMLEDTNGDGQYDKSTTFADDLAFPNGIMTLPDGSVLVTAAPQILRLKDTNGDGKADEREVLFSGFAEGNQQLRVNGLKWGIDGWIYCANGGVGRGDPNARVKVERTGELIDVGARDFRFSLDFKRLEPQLGMSQFGRNGDDYGNWFGCNNNTPLYHIVHDDAMLRRNPHLIPAATTVFVPQIPKPGPVYAISEKGRFYHASEVGRFTSANSAMIYRDRLLGDEVYGNFFVSEPVHNLVHRELVKRQGVSFTSSRAPQEQQSEFLASTDTWFRPNTIRTGPDGALYISDMYREIVEHPHWIQADKKAGLIFRKGDDRGRIWRVTKQGTTPRKVPHIAKLSTDEIVKLLNSPSGELRDQAQRWLAFNRPADVAVALAKWWETEPKTAAKAQVLWTQQLLGALPVETLTKALADVDPQVRAQAVVIARQRLASDPALMNTLLNLAADPDPAVQLQVAYALRECRADATTGAPTEAFKALLGKPDVDRFVQEAALSSLTPENIGNLPMAALPFPQQLEIAAVALRMKRIDVVEGLLDSTLDLPAQEQQYAKLAAILRLTSQAGLPLDKLLSEMKDSTIKARVTKAFAGARELADAGSYPVEHVAPLLGLGDKREEDVQRLVSFLSANKTPQAQAAAVTQLVSLATPQTADLLAAGWATHTPALRGQILDSLLSREPWTNALLAKLEAGDILASDLDATRRQRLLAHPNAKVKERAAKLLATSGSSDRQQVIAQWSKVTELKGDPVRGKAEFTKRCATCHKWQGEGASVGPDLNTLTDRSPTTLLTSILDPNLAVEPKYQAYAVTTEDGLVLSGMLVEETAASITLADAGGKLIPVARQDIAELRATGKSLMPEGLERDLTLESLADLLALLGNSSN